MKSKITLILVLGIFLFSCSKEYNLSLSVDTIELPLAGGEAEFTVTSDLNWAIVAKDSWLSVNPTYGNGIAVVVVKAGRNNTGAERTTELYVSAGEDMERTVVITQQ